MTYKVLAPKRGFAKKKKKKKSVGSTRLTKNRAGRDKDTVSDTAEQKNKDLSHSYKDKSMRSANIHQE